MNLYVTNIDEPKRGEKVMFIPPFTTIGEEKFEKIAVIDGMTGEEKFEQWVATLKPNLKNEKHEIIRMDLVVPGG